MAVIDVNAAGVATRAIEGVNVAGYLHAEVGVGEAARLLLAVLQRADIPYHLVPVRSIRSRQNAVVQSGSAEPFPINIVCVNSTELPAFAADVGQGFFAGRRTVGMWWWEVETFPDALRVGEHFVDEVWVGSHFVRDAIAPSVSCPVHVVQPPVIPHDSGRIDRAELGLPEGFVFLFCFDFNSAFERKNPVDLISAFTSAFEPHDRAALVLKSVNGDQHPERLAQLQRAAEGRDDVLVSDGYLDSARLHALFAACDAYASLHRAEGFGLPLADAMALGKPVVATAYGGNLDFMTDANSYLVPYDYAPIPPDAGPYPAGARWAQPDVEAAAGILRRVYEDAAGAAARGARAREDVLTRHTVDSRVPFVRQRLAALSAALAADGGARWSPLAGAAVLRAIADVRGVTEPATRSGIRGAARKLAYRLVFPALHRQTAYNQEAADVLGELAASVERQNRVLERILDDGDDPGPEAERSRTEDITAMRWPFSSISRYEPPSVPFTPEYGATHVKFVTSTLGDRRLIRRFAKGKALPRAYGVGLDERVVELPWLVAQEPRGRMLDAGSVLNHGHVLDAVLPRLDALHIVTLAPEEQTFLERGVSYVYADLRELPFRDDHYDTVVCISTLEHVGMDNSKYIQHSVRAADSDGEMRRALAELERVAAPGGTLLVTVPYGRREDHGWFRQLDADDVERLIDSLSAARVELTVFAYTARGWQRSDLRTAADASYRDYWADPRPVDDLAAAARAVACVRFDL